MKNLLITLLVIAVLVVVIILIVPSDSGDIDQSVEEDNSPAAGIMEENTENLVTYTTSGFSPNELTIEAGDTVTFLNENTQGMWVASDVHPTHRNYSGTSLSEHCEDGRSDTFDACRSIPVGENWSFTFDKPGEWNYHNHSNARDTGIIVVQ